MPFPNPLVATVLSAPMVSPAARVCALQLLCCAVVAWAGIRSAEFVAPPRQLAEAAFGMVQPSMRPVAGSLGVAVEAAEAGFPQIEVIVRRNDTLDQIFRRLELSLQDLANLRAMQGLKGMLDRLTPGELLTLSHQDGALMGLERRLSDSETLKVQRDEAAGFIANVEATPLTRTPVTTHGVIRSSLFEAAASAGMRDVTALQLAELFGWDIDFVLDLRGGDEFTVTYEKVSREGEYIGDGNILAAQFVNQGKTYKAVRYVGPDGKANYYTAEGRSLRKAFLKAPVEFSRISSVFNLKRKHPILNRIRAHNGVDYAAPTGTPVRAAGDGRVRFRGEKGGYGNVLEIEHAGQIVTRYGHLSRFAKGLAPGKRVSQGEVIAFVGMTGLATGPHLHFEYVVRGVYKNPQTATRSVEATPIDASLRADFNHQAAPLLAALASGTAPAQPEPTALPVRSGAAVAAR